MSVRTYYKKVRDTLLSLGIPFAVLEYEKDLCHDEDKLSLMESLLHFLYDDDMPDVDLQDARATLGLPKQAQVPVEKQVMNWDGVVRWGYGGPLKERTKKLVPGGKAD